MNKDLRLVDMTLGQLLEAIKEEFPALADNGNPIEEQFVFGLKGIADIYHCSISTAVRIKQSGKIDGAISPSGNTIAIDRQKALNLYNPKNIKQ